ncbi:MAG: D-aminoacylase [Dehalococcoidia bacterium]
MSESFDLLIRNGTIIDGTGTPGVRADIGVRGDRIAVVGSISEPAESVIDATGQVVAPGFIDVHAHDDGAVLTTPMDFKLMQGVTTDIVGNCGAGIAPTPGGRRVPGIELILGAVPDDGFATFGAYMDAVDRAHPAVNVACLVPHGAVRAAVIGMAGRAPDDGELESMKEYVDEGLSSGGVGLSTGLIYPPGMFAQTDEIIALARIAAEHGAPYVSHIRNEAEELMEAVEEAVTIGRESGAAVQISHHKAAAESVWGKTKESIAFIDEQRASGLDITFDVYPYTAGSTVLAAAARVERAIDPDRIMVASCTERHEYEGKTLREIGDMLGIPHEQVVARVLSEEPAAVAIFFSMHEDDVQQVVSHPHCMIGSDGIPSATGKPHPRLYGTFPRVIRRYVREEGLLSLEEAIRKMTSLPARRFNLAERGELRPGWFADIIVFDPNHIADIATYQEPRQYPEGISYVIVNGEVAAERGSQTAEHCGRLLRRGVA